MSSQFAHRFFGELKEELYHVGQYLLTVSHPMKRPIFASVLFAVLIGFSDAKEAFTKQQLEFFESNIRPLLAGKCFKCHGPKKTESSLRLDSRERLLYGGDRGPAAVVSNAADSLMLKAVRRQEKLKMPPKDEEALNEHQIAVLEKWINMGLPWPEGEVVEPDLGDQMYLFKQAETHWAFQPIKSPAMPKTRGKIENAIDAFIGRKLESKNLAASPAADRHTLLRRAYYDLVGLPPTFEQHEAFKKDKSANAFEKVVNDLLKSPHFGERWGRHWLDVARYADTRDWHSAIDMRYPYAYTYRDWVIDALNRDLPYDQFIKKQIAADSYTREKDSPDLAALGILTVGPRYLNRTHEIINDRIDVIIRGLMGLTVTCARCHDHKYDPIPTQDYYSLYGVFASIQEPGEYPLIRGYTIPEKARKAFDEEFGKKRAEFNKFLEKVRRDANADLHNRIGEYLLGVLDYDPKAQRDRAFTSARKLKRNVFAAMRSRMTDLYRKEQWNKDPALSSWAALRAVRKKEFPARLEEFLKKPPVDLNPELLKTLEKRPTAPRQLLEKICTLLGSVHKEWQELQKKEKEAAALPNPHREQIRQLMALAPFNLSLAEARRVLDGDERNKQRKFNRELKQIESNHPGAPPRAMAVIDKPAPYNPVVFKRGNPGVRGKSVPRRFLACIAGRNSPPFKEGSGRRGLAEAIASRTNPLTARVMVDRVWRLLFGKGLVRTPGDFGLRTPPPSHPDLLDHLAASFMKDGWSLKKLIRRIMLTSTYRQSSADRKDGAMIDPENRLFWRMNRRRMDFEAMRDSMLAASGLLDETMHGQSEKLFEVPLSKRRSVYGYIDRLNFSEILAAFDVPNPDQTNPARHHTAVPQRTLFQLNSPFIIQQARHIKAGDDFKNSTDRDSRIQILYRRIFGRGASKEELAMAADFLVGASDGAIGPATWQYGFGSPEPDAEPKHRFTRAPHFTGNSYQGSSTFPDPYYSYFQISAQGGHPGKDRNMSCIVRFVAPVTAEIEIVGNLKHANHTCGDGVRGVVLSRGKGIIGEWVAFKEKEAATNISSHPMKKGEILDFVLDMQENPSCDSYRWRFTINALDGKGSWDSQSSFSSPPEASLKPWDQLAQALLLTNEFMFVD